jgi:hypothetical protein
MTVRHKDSAQLVQLIEEELDLCLKSLMEQDYSETGTQSPGYDPSFDAPAGTGPSSYLRNPNTFGGALMTPVRGLYASVAGSLAKAATIGLSFIGTAIGGSIAGLLPFSDPKLVTHVARRMQSWEEKNVAKIERYFGKDLAAVKDGWNKIRGDFWGIGFIASPFNAIAAITAAGHGLDAAATVGNVISGGRLQQVLHTLSGGSTTSTHYSGDNYLNEQQKQGVSLPEYIKQLEKLKGKEETNKLLKKAIETTLKDPKAKQAEQAWVNKMLPVAVDGILQDVNSEVLRLAQAGSIPQAELQAYRTNRARAGEFVLNTMASRQGNKFKIEPSPTAKELINRFASKLPG